MQAEIERAQRSMASTVSPGPLGFNNTIMHTARLVACIHFRQSRVRTRRRFVGNTRLRHQVLPGPARAATKDRCFLFVYFFSFFLAAFFRRRIERDFMPGAFRRSGSNLNLDQPTAGASLTSWPVIAALQPGTLLARRPAAPIWASSEAAQGGPTVGQEDGISQTAKSIDFPLVALDQTCWRPAYVCMCLAGPPIAVRS